MQVHIVTFEYPHSRSVEVFDSLEKAKQCRLEYVKEFWFQDMREPLPLDAEVMESRFWEKRALYDEYAKIETHEVK